MGKARCIGPDLGHGALRSERLISGAKYLVRDPVDSDGGVVLFVHGLGSTAAAWSPVTWHAPERTGLLVPDLPGFGRSPTRGKAAPLDAATDMVVELLVRYMEQTPVTVVAHSVGAIVAMRALQQVDSRRMHRFVLVAGTLVSASRVLATTQTATAHSGLTAMVGIHVLAGVIPLDARGARTIARHRTLRAALLWPFLAYPQQVSEPDLLAVLPHPGGSEAVRAVWSARNVDIRALMAQTEVSTRIVCGDHDRLIHPGDVNVARSLLDPDEVVVLEGCGHWPHIERPAETAAAVFEP
jgi:pimeloyl-ACP methyl ester carboxylesterase